jgi:4-amino-4-deoxy-L-arabinose transferase-like glycosyltransferase
VLGALSVVALFSIPLFRGLDRWDLQNDEAIYSYAVDRMIDGAGWGTPRSSPYDGTFLEKPPLKLWMVAGPIDAGLLPHDEAGMRVIDALLGGVAFLYVYLLGVALAGPVCGFVAALVLVTFDPLLFEHGLRSNNMEAALLLCQVGGLYHFARWVESDTRPRAHALAVAGYFVLGFMTKFVAAVFLPLVAIVALAWRRQAWARVQERWRDWIAPACLAVLAIAPWFLYQTQRSHGEVWSVMLGQHVYTRFTAALDPQHLEPWPFYFTQTWKYLRAAESAWIVVAGAVTLSVAAWRQNPWLARLVLVWGVLPIVLLSFGTSKLYHYLYPFLPPIALAAGHAAAVWVGVFTRSVRGLIGDGGPLAPTDRDSMTVVGLRTAAVAIAAGAIALSIWTIVRGDVRLDWAGVTLFRSSSVLRPLAFAALFFVMAGQIGAFARTLAMLPLIVLLPLSAWHRALDRTETFAAPLKAIRDCGVSLRASGQVGEGFYNAASRLVYHSYFYYLRRLGRWQDATHPDPAEVRRRLETVGRQTPVLLSQSDYDKWSNETRSGSGPHQAAAIASGDGIVVLLPGAYEVCVPLALQAGAKPASPTHDRISAALAPSAGHAARRKTYTLTSYISARYMSKPEAFGTTTPLEVRRGLVDETDAARPRRATARRRVARSRGSARRGSGGERRQPW